ncbi:BON domain protein [Planctomycetes bacterium CA13]|uniref:BON domain protein n=1 Tax=Novipirellula herctigrandis TaxID=2527986 RepID=A0A5C5Z4C6_9BACT|nr:BON domain protein [Planctomycetes bacterium CA13]
MIHVRLGAMVFIGGMLAALPVHAQTTNDPASQTGDQTTGIAGALDPSTAFSAIQRGDSIGDSSDSSQGFGLGAVSGNNTGAGGGFGGGFGGGLGGLSGFGNLFGNNAGGATTPAIRTRLRSAIQVPPVSPLRTQQRLTRQLQSLPSQGRLPNVNVNMNGQTAVLNGTVQSERERRMSELLMRLEPGVRMVENRIQIQP